MKILKGILLVGNDWLTHVVIAVFFVFKFGWWGLIPIFISHFIIDMIPHGHVDNDIVEALKGVIVGLAIILYCWIKINFPIAFLMGIGIFISIAYDFIFTVCKYMDGKKYWDKFENYFLKNLIFKFVQKTIQLNNLTHWAGNNTWCAKLWKREEHYNSLPNKTHHSLNPGWVNLIQPIMALIFVVIFW